MLLTDRVEVDPRVMLGKPVIRGTRITVEACAGEAVRRCDHRIYPGVLSTSHP